MTTPAPTPMSNDHPSPNPTPPHLRVLLHRPPQRVLRVLRHAVGLVQDQQLVGRAGVPRRGRPHRPRRERLDLLADDVDPALVRGVQLHHTRLHQLGAVELGGGVWGEGRGVRSLLLRRQSLREPQATPNWKHTVGTTRRAAPLSAKACAPAARSPALLRSFQCRGGRRRGGAAGWRSRATASASRPPPPDAQPHRRCAAGTSRPTAARLSLCTRC